MINILGSYLLVKLSKQASTSCRFLMLWRIFYPTAMRSPSIPLEWTQTMKSKLKNEKECGKDLLQRLFSKSSSSLLLLLKVWEQVQYRLRYSPCIHHAPVDIVATVTPLTPEKFGYRGRGRCNVCCLNPFPWPYFRPKHNKLLTLLLKFQVLKKCTKFQINVRF